MLGDIQQDATKKNLVGVLRHAIRLLSMDYVVVSFACNQSTGYLEMTFVLQDTSDVAVIERKEEDEDAD